MQIISSWTIANANPWAALLPMTFSIAGSFDAVEATFFHVATKSSRAATLGMPREPTMRWLFSKIVCFRSLSEFSPKSETYA